MNSAIQEVEKIRKEPIQEAPIKNRYALIVKEKDQSKTAYCFGVPIRASTGEGVLERQFYYRNKEARFSGSCGRVIVSDCIIFENEHGMCRLDLPGAVRQKTKTEILFESSHGAVEITPTLNGLLYKCNCPPKGKVLLRFSMKKIPHEVRGTDKCIAWLRERFVPFVTLSGIGFSKTGKEITSPCHLSLQAVTDTEYTVAVSSPCKCAGLLFFEINLHDVKLFQDTTVESKHPTENNAFGGMAFLGSTDAFGEQWLYMRTDLKAVSGIFSSSRIKAAKLYLPCWGAGKREIALYRLGSRFCSFGSNWESRLMPVASLDNAASQKDYFAFDITESLQKFDGGLYYLIRRTDSPKSKRATILSTGDNFARPPILAIHYV